MSILSKTPQKVITFIDTIVSKREKSLDSYSELAEIINFFCLRPRIIWFEAFSKRFLLEFQPYLFEKGFF